MSTQRNRIETLLPSFMQRAAESNAPLAAMLDSMAALVDPDVSRFEEIETLFDPRQVEERFVPFLAGWVDLGRVYEIPVPFQPRRGLAVPGIGRIGGSLRELVAVAAELSQFRGTTRGLVRFLEVATGVVGFRIEDADADEQGAHRAFHITLVVPEAAREQESLVARILAMEKPAHVTARIAYDGGPASPEGA